MSEIFCSEILNQWILVSVVLNQFACLRTKIRVFFLMSLIACSTDTSPKMTFTHSR